MVVLLLRLVSNDSSLALLPALTFVFVKVVDHVATRVLEGKLAAFTLAQRHFGGGLVENSDRKV